MSDPNIKITPLVDGGTTDIELLPKEPRDTALGKYMDAFGRLEGGIKFTISDILQVEHASLNSVFAILGTKQLIDWLEAVSQENLSDKGAARVRALCERLRTRNMRRNHIVHGHWQFTAIVKDGQIIQQWVRHYDHPKPAMRNLVYDDPKLAGIYAFTIRELGNATDHVQEVILALSALMAELPSLRPPQPTPEESQSR